MKVALLCESAAEEEGLSILAQGLLGAPVDLHRPSFNSRGGWTGLRHAVAPVCKALHYSHPEVNGLIIVGDSDDSPLHAPEHGRPGAEERACRICDLERLIAEASRGLRPRQQSSPLRVAIGIAVPAIEAWWLFGRDPHVGEATWQQSRPGAGFELRRNLKKQLYGPLLVTSQVIHDAAVREAQRLVRDGKLLALQRHFPVGFGALADSLQAWRSGD